jgi:tetratricopeptide (TPR) repeat protein
MSNDYVLAEAIQLIKSGKKHAARVMLERYLQRNPDNIQAWMWEAETFPDDSDKITVLEACLKNNPGDAQVTQALNFLKSRAVPAKSVSPFTTSPFIDSPSTSSPFTNTPASAKKPLPFIDTPPVKQPPPFTTTTSPFLPESDTGTDQQKKKPLPSPSPFESAEPEKPAAPGKRPARKNSKITDILIVAGVVLVFALLIGGYISGGFYLNGQINKSFAAQKCKDVVQHSSFSSLYPRVMFSSAFTGYDQYTQCRLKLDMEQAAETKDWGTALMLAQQYTTLYPQGVFAADINEQSISILSSWSKKLIADKNYNSGIEKSQQLLKMYPDIPTAESVRDDILQTYLTWAKEFTDQKNYTEAEQKLNNALVYFESDTARAEKIKHDLVKVYIGWGDSQVEIGNMDGAIKYYQQAGDLSQGATDVNLLIAKAYLQQALAIADKDDFTRALSKVQEVANTAQADNVKVEVNAARETVLKKYSESNSMQAADQITTVIPMVCKGQRPELPIFGLDEKNIRFGLFTSIILPLPKELTAETPGQLHYVACVEEKEKDAGSCPYKAGHTLYRLRYEWTVTLYNVVTGNIFNSQVFTGGAPPECKSNELFTKGVTYKKSYGSKPTVDKIAAWLQELNIRK